MSGSELVTLLPRLVAVTVAAAIAIAANPARAGEFTVLKDGSVTFSLRTADDGRVPASLQLGLPSCPPAKVWSEGAAQRLQWLTNGIRYTETVFAADVSLPQGTNRILFVNIEGENTNSEYTEASACISIAVSGVSLGLGLVSGIIRGMGGGMSNAVALLEIPESGIRVAEGRTLQFSGNIPPSLNGSMTLKLPLDARPDDLLLERFRDVEYPSVLRRILRSSGASQGN